MDHVLKTNMGRTLVQKYEVTTYNTQQIWKEFLTNTRSSTKAEIESGEILAWITSANFDSTWKGSTNSFVYFWVKKVPQI